MKERPWGEKYLKLSGNAKRKAQIEWCIRLLRLDIDKMPSDEFYGLVEEYECIVAYPEYLGLLYVQTGLLSVAGLIDIEYPDEQEIFLRAAFKKYQEIAKKIIHDFEKMRDKAPPGVRLSTEMKFTVRVNLKGIFSTSDETGHDFKYSYARRIARLLNGKKFDDIIKICPVCGHYLVKFTKHEKQCCSHRCAMLLVNKKKFDENYKLARKRGNIHSYFSDLKRKGFNDAQLQSFLRSYKKKNNYSPEEIPRNIEKFLGEKGER